MKIHLAIVAICFILWGFVIATSSYGTGYSQGYGSASLKYYHIIDKYLADLRAFKKG